LTTSMPASANTASNAAANCPARSRTRNRPEVCDVVAEVHHQVARLLRGPGAVGVRGHAQDVQVAVADLEYEQDVESPQRDRAVDVEVVDGEHAGRLRAQELPPAGPSSGFPAPSAPPARRGRRRSGAVRAGSDRSISCARVGGASAESRADPAGRGANGLALSVATTPLPAETV
jgi:hypothetical protein